MLIEWIQSKLTSASKTVRTIGFVNSTVALEARHKRCAKQWQPHLDKCHRAILENLPATAKRILILGSGPLLEVPIEELLKRGLKIVLVDVVHPAKPKKFASRYPEQIELIEADVTGIVELIKAKDFEAIQCLQFHPPVAEWGHFDYVVSANLISQLALDPYEALKRYKWADDAFFGRLAKSMGDAHLDWLKNFKTKTLIIADVERTYFDTKGTEIEKVTSAYRLNRGERNAAWDWEISPLGEVSKNFCYIMHVETRIL